MSWTAALVRSRAVGAENVPRVPAPLRDTTRPRRHFRCFAAS